MQLNFELRLEQGLAEAIIVQTLTIVFKNAKSPVNAINFLENG